VYFVFSRREEGGERREERGGRIVFCACFNIKSISPSSLLTPHSSKEFSSLLEIEKSGSKALRLPS
jgi:hypothetical protein